MRLQTQTASSLVARTLTMRTRAGSPRARNSAAVPWASSSDRAGAASGAQQTIGRRIDIPRYIDNLRYEVNGQARTLRGCGRGRRRDSCSRLPDREAADDARRLPALFECAP